VGTYVTGTDIGSAWLAAFRALKAQKGSIVNLAVDITAPMTEDVGVRRAIEDGLAGLRDSHHRDFAGAQSMHTVANTVFPISLYRPDTEGAAARFIANALKGEQNRRHASHRRWGTYLGRLVAYPARDGRATNQLAINLERLSGKDRQWSDLYQVPITSPDGDHDDPDWEDPGPDSSATGGAVLHGDTRLDHLRRGGPCLAHISLTLDGGVVSMLALYRRHSYVPRAYGNFLGLSRLLYFMAHESGHDVGNLMVVTGHATVDAPGRANLLAAAEAAAGTSTPIEIGARPLGATWSDLDLRAPTVGASAS
jgi:hypothetical protein